MKQDKKSYRVPVMTRVRIHIFLKQDGKGSCGLGLRASVRFGVRVRVRGVWCG